MKKYRMLKKGEVVKKDDQMIMDEFYPNGEWSNVIESIGKKVGSKITRGIHYRRPIPAPKP